ncbi:MAG: hypothetical protein WB992_10705, partial [Bryobacteraceae bacterium]
MLICPKCNIEVPNPEYVPAPPWWRRRGWSNRPRPVCPKGHRLRHWLFGYLTELSLPLAFLRGLLMCCFALVYGIIRDLREPRLR